MPDYPTEPVCIIRKTIKDLRGRKELWYEVDENTNEQELIKRVQEDIQQYILPFFKQYDSVEKIFYSADSIFPSFGALVFYGEHGYIEKAQKEYNELLKDINPLAERTLKGYAKKYGLNI